MRLSALIFSGFALANVGSHPSHAGDRLQELEIENVTLQNDLAKYRAIVRQKVLHPDASPRNEADCSEMLEAEPRQGTQCRTSQGYLFTRVRLDGAMGWRDPGGNGSASGRTWFDREEQMLDQDSAVATCSQTRGQELPSKETFADAVSRGLLEILKSLLGRDQDGSFKLFWTRSLHPAWSKLGFIFFGSNQTIGYFFRKDRFRACHARCVSIE